MTLMSSDIKKKKNFGFEILDFESGCCRIAGIRGLPDEEKRGPLNGWRPEIKEK